MSSLPATDDGNAKPLAKDPGTGSGDSEDISRDADTEPGTADAAWGPEAAGAEPRVDIECAVDSAATGAAEGTLLVQLLDGLRQIATQAATVKVSGRGVSTTKPSMSRSGAGFGRRSGRYRSGEVALNLSGPATLVGDNPFAFGQYGGLGAVWIRSLAGQPGAITLTASHPLLGQAEIQLRSELAKHLNELD